MPAIIRVGNGRCCTLAALLMESVPQCAGDAHGESVPAVSSTASAPGASPAEVVPSPQPEEVLITGRPGLSGTEACLVQRFDPAGPRHTIGFFIARFRKRSLI